MDFSYSIFWTYLSKSKARRFNGENTISKREILTEKVDCIETQRCVQYTITVICVTYVQKGFSDSNFKQAIIDKIFVHNEIVPL